MNSCFTELVEQKLVLAQKIYSGEIPESQSDAGAILWHTLFSMASRIWPPPTRSGKRFPEMLVKYAENSLGLKRICYPLLMHFFLHKNELNNAMVLESILPESYRRFNNKDNQFIIRSEDVDPFENELNFNFKFDSYINLRTFSIANYFFIFLRSDALYGYLSNSCSIQFQDEKNLGIYYQRKTINEKPDFREGDISNYNRGINFSYFWLVNVIRSILKTIEIEKIEIPQNVPKRWWVDKNE